MICECTYSFILRHISLRIIIRLLRNAGLLICTFSLVPCILISPVYFSMAGPMTSPQPDTSRCCSRGVSSPSDLSHMSRSGLIGVLL